MDAFWTPNLMLLGAKMASKMNKKINEKLIVFWEAILRGQVIPAGLQPSEPGCRGGVGEGSR